MDPTRRELFAAPLAGTVPDAQARQVRELAGLVAALSLRLTETDERVSTLSKTSPPIGTVIMWWGDRQGVPPGWEVCDGGLASTAGALLAGVKPNIIDRFPKGAAAGRRTVADLAGAVGGNNNMPALRIDSLAGAEVVNAGEHRHHVSQYQNDGHTGNRGAEVSAHNVNNDPRFWSTDRERDLSMQPAGDHTHKLKGYVGPETGVLADGRDATGANQPAYQEVFFLIRVK